MPEWLDWFQVARQLVRVHDDRSVTERRAHSTGQLPTLVHQRRHVGLPYAGMVEIGAVRPQWSFVISEA